MISIKRLFVPVLALASVFCLLPAASAALVAADTITVGTVTANSAIVDVPVYIRDLSGTPLGVDQPPGSKIQAYSIKVDYAPASSIQSVTFTRAGITTSLTPTFESSPSSAGSITLLDTFQESTNLIPFTLNAAAPGDQVAHLKFTLASSVPHPSTITLTLDPVLTQLSNEAGTTVEKTTSANLTLVSGSIIVPAGFIWDLPTISEWGLILLAVALAFVAIRTRV